MESAATREIPLAMAYEMENTFEDGVTSDYAQAKGISLVAAVRFHPFSVRMRYGIRFFHKW